jgi:hypothetical protein
MSPSADISESWGYALGLALLYTSGFYLPEVGVPQNHWLPCVAREVLIPSAIGTMILVPIMRLILVRSVRSRIWNPIGQISVVAVRT